jgi:signal transduction histidine kinase
MDEVVIGNRRPRSGLSQVDCSQMAAVDDLRSWARKQGAPANLAIMASIVATALLFWFTNYKSAQNFGVAIDSHLRPWSFLVYPWINMPFTGGLELIFFVFLMMWLFMTGSFVEREIGSVRYGVIWLIASAIIGLSYWVGTQVLNFPGMLLGAFLPVSAVTMLWCARNQTTTIMLYGIIPLSGKWLAVVDVVAVLLLFGNGAALQGVFAALPLVGLYLYALDRIPGLAYRPAPRPTQATRAQARYDDRYYDDVKKREQEREERERLRKLFEGD